MTVVTAGHCIFSDDKTTGDKYGETYATDIDVYLGYDPRGYAERRKGTGVIIHRSWYQIQDSRYDVAVIRLESPFENGNPFKTKDITPKLVNKKLQIVGYPFDIPPYIRAHRQTAGKVMYKSHWITTFKNPEERLKYRADTAKGK